MHKQSFESIQCGFVNSLPISIIKYDNNCYKPLLEKIFREDLKQLTAHIKTLRQGKRNSQ